MAREVVIDRGRLALVLVAHRRLRRRALEPRWRRRPPDGACLEELIELAVRAHEERHGVERHAIAHRIAVGGAERPGVGAARRKARSGAGAATVPRTGWRWRRAAGQRDGENAGGYQPSADGRQPPPRRPATTLHELPLRS